MLAVPGATPGIVYRQKTLAFMPDLQRLCAITLILCGSLILIISLRLFQRAVSFYRRLTFEQPPGLLILFRVHSCLILFFVVSYFVVAYGLFTAQQADNGIVVGVVFFAGSVFVLLGVVVQSRMLESVSHQIDKTENLSGALADEQSRVAEVLDELDFESTQLRESEADRTRIEQQLERVRQYELLGHLAGSIAHDVNNQLSPIVALPELLLSSVPEDFKQRNLLKQMHDSGLAISSYVNNLLALSNRDTTLHEDLSLNVVVDNFLESEEYRRATEQSITNPVTWQLASDIHTIHGSVESLHRLINNLVTNAIEASSSNSTIQLATRNEYIDQTQQLSHDSLPPGDYVVLNVADQGRGMTPEELKSLFQPFQTSKAVANDEIIGLGLICVRAIVDDHDAKVNVESRASQGTVIDVYFPSKNTPTADIAGPLVNLTDATTLPQQSGTHVLVVDDMKTQRQLAETLLAHLGCTTTSVPSGEEAVEILKSSNFDLILLDMRLGKGMDGLTTLREIKCITPTAYVIIASGYSKNKRVRAAVELGAQFMKKPYHLERLERALHQFRSFTQPVS